MMKFLTKLKRKSGFISKILFLILITTLLTVPLIRSSMENGEEEIEIKRQTDIQASDNNGDNDRDTVDNDSNPDAADNYSPNDNNDLDQADNNNASNYDAIQAVQLRAEQTAEYQEFDGFTVPGETVPVVPGIGGEVKNIHVSEGDQVQEGQLLLELESEELDLGIKEAEAALEQARLELDMAETGAREEELEMAKAQKQSAEKSYELARDTYERIEYLYDEGVVPKSDLDEAEMALIEAEASLEAASQELEMAETGARPEELDIARKGIEEAEYGLEIARVSQDDLQVTAPKSGVIAQIELSEGELTGGESLAMAILDLDEIIFEVEAPARRLTDIEVGQQAELEFDSQPDQTYQGEISSISPAADEDSGLFEFEIAIANPDLSLKAGEYGQARVQIGQESDAFRVPQSAVFSEAGQDYIYVIRDQMLREIEIEILDEIAAGENNDFNGEADSYLIEGDLQSSELVAAEYDEDFYSGQEAELLEVIDW
ncbi:efflux RND transporter periplasmic adaptor subunit [Halanaerobiaceae bacterium Z-7014]|uniref:Efflux RND transporter periplasmic adaptor subunit n=1 Tax=Halonatronomonas betaini TaxID=2778430 RepID=A0A931AST1_9FIRM|nr:efflux RND transporter periplasmic adaptor subunit [Halonatronomonas betaini]MBF8437494.1 efflux RND transporter periplasmic adaptor subunit [Halonatronomonas betaini]